MKSTWKNLFNTPIEIVKYEEYPPSFLKPQLREPKENLSAFTILKDHFLPKPQKKFDETFSAEDVILKHFSPENEPEKFMNDVNNHLKILNLQNEYIDLEMAKKYIDLTFTLQEAINDILMVYYRVNGVDINET